MELSNSQPLRQARQPLRQRCHKKMTLSATDEFWHSPVLELEDSNSTTSNDISSTSSTLPTSLATTSNDQDDFFEVISLPPAHHQLLFDDQKSYEPLKGYDHAQGTIDDDDVDDSPYGSGDHNSSNDSYRQKLSAVKQQGGGSWLLGFARLNDGFVPPREESDDRIAPGMVRVSSGASLESDECSTSESESDDESLPSDDDTPTTKKRQRSGGGGVSFSSTVAVQSIPHSCTLTPLQRRKIYTTCLEVRQNKIRNKKEFRWDNYNWRNATEEWEMGVDMVTGELIHPVHDHC